MNLQERVKMVRAMETVMRNINDEEVFDGWLMFGVADGDIDEDTTDEYLYSYCDDDQRFSELMGEFVHLLVYATRNGKDEAAVLWCDGVLNN